MEEIMLRHMVLWSSYVCFNQFSMYPSSGNNSAMNILASTKVHFPVIGMILCLNNMCHLTV